MLRGQRTENRELGPSDKGKVWLNALKWVSSSLKGINYAFVKLLTNPLVLSDIDILIAEEKEREKALEALGGRENFSSGAFLEGSGRFILRLGNLDVDIYPDACWGGLKIADGREIVEHRIRVNHFGIKLEVPSPDDSFYLIATHAYSHLNIRQAELENCRRLSQDSNFNVKRVMKLAESYGMEPIIATFCDALDINTRWGYTNKLKLSHGIKLPKSFVLKNFHTHKLLGKASLRELASDFAWHLVRPITKSMGLR